MHKFIVTFRCYLLIGFCGLFCAACHSEKREVFPAFYHWQTELDLSDFEKNYLQKTGVQKIYVKFFDVDKEGEEIIPKALIYGDSLAYLLREKTIVPTIFITNRTLKNISEAEISDLAQKMVAKITYLATSHQLLFSELQLDCDWTLTTKDAYFTLIHQIRQLLPATVKISATIRLHQIKFYDKTGVPPVDRGMLMYYNMGDLEDKATANSIIDNTIGSQYLQNARHYPLELDMALPIFAWGVLFRDGRMIRLINDLRGADLADTSRFEKSDPTHFAIKQSSYLKSYYLYAGDEIRLEKSEFKDLEEAAAILSPLVNTDQMNLVFYHLDSTNLATFSPDYLKKIVRIFENEK